MKTTVLLLLLVLTLGVSVFCSNTLRVPGEVATIQEAINASSPGDTVLIAPGTYAVNLVISTNVELRAEIADSPPILKAASWDQAIIKVEGECDVQFESIVVQESYGIAIHVKDTAQLALLHCTFVENEMDLFMSNSSTARISECNFSHF